LSRERSKEFRRVDRSKTDRQLSNTRLNSSSSSVFDLTEMTTDVNSGDTGGDELLQNEV